MDVVVLIPVLRRPHRVEPLLASLVAATPQPYRALFIASPSDEAEQDAVRAAGGDLLVMEADHWRGDYARKINAGYAASTEPLLFLAADDLHFHPNWLKNAAARISGRVQVVGTNDLGNQRVISGEHSTHTLVTRSYVDEFGTIDEPDKVLHEGYPHEFVDDEFVQTARSRKCWDHASDSIVEHLHPHWGKAPTDALYDGEPERMEVGRRIYRQRRRLWMSPSV